jgi:ribosomal protein S12 methylthiotransferase accessory factor
VETFHAETITLPVRYAPRQDLALEHRLADVDRLALVEPGGLAEDRPILWIEGRDAFDGSGRWLPLEVVGTDYTLPQPPGSGIFRATTNGLASGNTADEARLHAVCELIERDATALWHLGGDEVLSRSRLDLDSVDDPAALDLLDRLARAQVEVGVWETTSDIGVASFIALIADRMGGSGPETIAGRMDGADPEIGAGCHPSRGVALCRALAEAAQARVGFISGARDDLLPALYAPAARRQRAERARSWLTGAMPARRFGDAPELAGDTPALDLAIVLGKLRTAGLDEALVVDLTKPSFGIPVVRIVVPGLEGPFADRAGSRPGQRARAVVGRRR